MRKFVAVDGAGRIVFEAQCPTQAEADHLAAVNGVAAGMTEVPMAVQLLATWWDGSSWAPRPLPPAPPALVAGVEAVWSGLPVGAVVTVTDPETGIVAGTDTASGDGEVSIALPAGPWRIAVNEVFPSVAAAWDIEVASE